RRRPRGRAVPRPGHERGVRGLHRPARLPGETPARLGDSFPYLREIAERQCRYPGRPVHRQFPGDARPGEFSGLPAAKEAGDPPASIVTGLVCAAVHVGDIHAHAVCRSTAARAAAGGRGASRPWRGAPSPAPRRGVFPVALNGEWAVDLTYASYLKLDQLLSLQQPRSDPPEHDELLFIIVHQTYELWFKLLLHELEKIRRDFHDNHLYGAISTFKRARTILEIRVEQVDIVETLTPMSFSSFRNRLEHASGFQSAQFRELEFLLGYKRPDMLRYQTPDTPAYERLVRRLHEPSLIDAFYDFLQQRGVTIPAGLRRPDVTLPTV